MLEKQRQEIDRLQTESCDARIGGAAGSPSPGQLLFFGALESSRALNNPLTQAALTIERDPGGARWDADIPTPSDTLAT